MVPLAADALLFFACAKKSKQKKAHPGGPPAAAQRVRSSGGNFRAGHPAPYENGARPVRRPCGVVPAGTAGPQGAQEPKRTRPHLLLLLLLGPHEARRVGRVTPEGRRPGWAAFSYGTGM